MSTARPGWGRMVASLATGALGLSLLTALPAAAETDPPLDIVDTRDGDRATVLGGGGALRRAGLGGR